MVVSRDEHSAAALVSKGILDTLCKVGQSAHLRSKLADCTLQHVLNCNLSAKYSLKRKLNQTDIIKDGFYDSGLLHPEAKFVALAEHRESEINDKQAVLLINIPSLVADQNKQTEAKNISSVKSSAKLSADGKERKHKHKREQSLMIPTNNGKEPNRLKAVTSKSAVLEEPLEQKKQSEVTVITAYDVELMQHIDNAVNQLNNQQTVHEQIAIIAEIVSNAFGGALLKSELIEFGYELAMVELKRKNNSNVIALGSIKKGLYRERALLFKIICDHIGLPVTLEQREYRRAWNSIVFEGEELLIDLLSRPGHLYPKESSGAVDYITV